MWIVHRAGPWEGRGSQEGVARQQMALGHQGLGESLLVSVMAHSWKACNYASDFSK